MKEFINKLIERLEEEHERCINRYGVVGGNLPAIEVKQCMEIVNQLAEEYKGTISKTENVGWIPCSEKLPEDDRDVLVMMPDGSMMVDFKTASSSGWFWSDNDDMPLAWHELPQPYQPKGE